MAKAPAPRKEHEEQALAVNWAWISSEMQTDPAKKLALRWLHAIPNGFHKGFAARRKAKAEGVKSGILDLFLPAPELKEGVRKSGVYHGLAIEMKRKGEKMRPSQIEYADFLDMMHYRTALCYHWTDAARIIVEHLDLTDYFPIDEEAVPELIARSKALEAERNPPKEKSDAPKRKSRPRRTAAERRAKTNHIVGGSFQFIHRRRRGAVHC